MRLAFMGTPEFAVPTLDALVAAGHDVVAVYTQPPRPANRGKKLTPSAVQQRAEGLGLVVRSPLSLRQEDAQAEFAALDSYCPQQSSKPQNMAASMPMARCYRAGGVPRRCSVPYWLGMP